MTRTRRFARLAGLAAVAAALASPVLAQTRGDQVQPKPTTAPPPRTAPTRTVPALPVDPGMTGLPATGSPGQTGPDYAPMGPGGTRTVRPRRATAPPPETGPGDEIPYVDPPAAPGYESASDGPMKTAGGKPAPSTATHAAAPAVPAAPPKAPTAGAAPASPPPPPVVASPAGGHEVTIVEGPAQPASNPNALWIALGGLAAMLAAAGLGLRHVLAAPRLSFRVTVDHGVQSAPRFKGAAS